MVEKAAQRDPRIVGYGDGGKPRVRVQQGFDYREHPYRNLTMPGQAMWGAAGFSTSASGKNEGAPYRDVAVRAAQDLDRNSEIIRGGLDRKTNTVVGPSLRVNPMPNWRRLGLTIEQGMELAQQQADVFGEWSTDSRCLCDAEGHYQFGGLMWQAFRTLAGPDAEVAGYIGYDAERRTEFNHEWATFVHLVDPARVSSPNGRSDGRIAPAQRNHENSWELFRGRELDRKGRMLGIHVRRTHPGDASAERDDNEHDYIPRETEWGRPMAFHWFFKRRAGMQRALTSLVTSLRHIKMLDKFDDATLQNAVVSGILATYVKTTMKPEEVAAHLAPAGEEEVLGEEAWSEFEHKLDHYEKLDLKIGDQRVPVMGPNDEIKFQRMADAMPNADEFRNGFLRYFASALGVSFEQLSLDFSRANYSSTRSSIIEAWRQVVTERYMFTVHIAKLIYDAVMEEAFALGKIEVPAGAPGFYEARAAYTACSWTGPGMGWVDPKKEADAAGVRKKERMSTLEQENAAQGNNWRDTLDQQAIEKAYAESLGLDYEPAAPGQQAAAGGDEEDQDESDARETREAA